MKFFLIAFLSILGYVGANCGCLKCSKHLTVLGEIPSPGQLPIKVISRGDHGYPCGEFVPVQPIAVQVPVPKPEINICTGGGKYPVQVQPFYKTIGSDGCYVGCGAIRGPLAAHNPCASPHTQCDYYHGSIVPVKVQVPIPKPEVEKKCVTLQGLRTALDRIIIPCPPFPATGITPWDIHTARGSYLGHDCCHHHHHHHHGYDSCHDRYDHQNINPLLETLNFANQHSHSRSKRQILQHGYKFIVNMLPPFIKDPLKNVVNTMAITHPDPKLRNIYNIPPPPLTLKEKIQQKHKENVDALKNKLYGTPIPKKPLMNNYYQPTKSRPYVPFKNQYKYTNTYVDERMVKEEADNFIDSLQIPHIKRNRPYLRSRTDLLQSKNEPPSWINEKRSSEILGKQLYKPFKKGMSEEEKAVFLLKLQKLNQDTKRRKRDTDSPKGKSKRSIIIGSDELDLPLYQIKIQSEEESEQSNEDYDSDYDYEYDNERVGSRFRYPYEEKVIRAAIREELQKFKQVHSDEEIVGNEIYPFHDNTETKFPLLNVITFPLKFLKKIKHTEDFPIMGAVPRMIIETKNYFKDFGKNFKKNFLHLGSDLIGDFDHYGSNNAVLAKMIKRNRFARSVDATENNKTENFREISDAKVRKKRYILKMVDDDEIEELLRQKLGKMFDEPRRSHKPKRKSKVKAKTHHGNSIEHKDHYKKRERNYSDESIEEHRERRKRVENKKVKKSHDFSKEDLEKKIIVEPIRPKVIIDNNGLPFMEVDGYKRPLFLKKFKKDKNFREEISMEIPDSSEEFNMERIHDVINNAKNNKVLQSRYPEMPLETLKEKISQLLHEIDILVHMDFEKYDDVYDDLIEIQSVKTSIVQTWKRIVMNKKINDYDAKIKLLEKFEDLQHLKSRATHRIVHILHDDCENNFALKKIIQALMMLHKIQCMIDQVVGCFQEKFQTGTKFDLSKEMKFVDFLSSLKFVRAKTRNDMVAALQEERDVELQENIILLEKLKKLLVEGDEALIEEEANILWEMKHVHKMQLSTIEEMCERLDEGFRIKKNMKVLFDLARRLKELEVREKNTCIDTSNKSSGEEDKSEEDTTKVKKFDLEEFKKKWQEKSHKQKELIEESFKKRVQKLKELNTVQKQKELLEEAFKKNMLKLKAMKELKKKNKSDENKVETYENKSNSDEDEEWSQHEYD